MIRPLPRPSTNHTHFWLPMVTIFRHRGTMEDPESQNSTASATKVLPPQVSPVDYLERHVLPILVSGLEETLRVAKKTETRKRFNSLDYLAGYLYRHNPNHSGRDDISFEEIPFVKEEWAKNPRPPLPLSATLTEDEAARIIQSFYRGYIARKESGAALFRTWQKCVWKERKAAQKIQKFWRKTSVAKGPSALTEEPLHQYRV